MTHDTDTAAASTEAPGDPTSAPRGVGTIPEAREGASGEDARQRPRKAAPGNLPAISPSPFNRARATTRFRVKPWAPHLPAYQRG